MLACADGDGVLDGDDPNAPIANLTRLGCRDDGVDRFLDIAVADHYGEESALDATGEIGRAHV